MLSATEWEIEILCWLLITLLLYIYIYLNNMILSNTLFANVSQINWLPYQTFGMSKQAQDFIGDVKI